MTDEPATIDILPLLDELRVIGQNGLMDAESPYDRERNERLLELASEYYARAVELPSAEVRERLAGEVGYATAKVSAGAAVFNDDGEILLMKRADNGKWGFPAGGVEPNESAPEAAVRETREEVGLDVEPRELVGVYYEAPNQVDNPHSVVPVFYLCEVVGGELRCSHETAAVRYWDIDEVPAWHSNAEAWVTDAHRTWLEANGCGTGE